MPPKATPVKKRSSSPDSSIASDHSDPIALSAHTVPSEFAHALTELREMLAALTTTVMLISEKVDNLTPLTPLVLEIPKLCEIALEVPILREDIDQLRSFNSEFKQDAEETKTIQSELRACSDNYRSITQRIDEITDQPSIAVMNKIYTKLTGTLELFNGSLISFKRSTVKQFLATQDLQEMNHNPVAGPSDDSFSSMIQALHGFRKYKSGNGSISFYQLLLRSPDVLELYLEKARRLHVQFEFNSEDDTIFFRELLDYVFFPDGITVSAFQQLVSMERMSEFTSKSAAKFKTWVYFLKKTLNDHLPLALLQQLWDRVARCAFPPAFQ